MKRVFAVCVVGLGLAGCGQAGVDVGSGAGNAVVVRHLSSPEEVKDLVLVPSWLPRASGVVILQNEPITGTIEGNRVDVTFKYIVFGEKTDMRTLSVERRPGAIRAIGNDVDAFMKGESPLVSVGFPDAEDERLRNPNAGIQVRGFDLVSTDDRFDAVRFAQGFVYLPRIEAEKLMSGGSIDIHGVVPLGDVDVHVYLWGSLMGQVDMLYADRPRPAEGETVEVFYSQFSSDSRPAGISCGVLLADESLACTMPVDFRPKSGLLSELVIDDVNGFAFGRFPISKGVTFVDGQGVEKTYDLPDPREGI